MTTTEVTYLIFGVLSGSILMTLFWCLVFRATEPKRDVTAEIFEGLREPMWKIPPETPEGRKARLNDSNNHAQTLRD
jgi:hypothetical protein